MKLSREDVAPLLTIVAAGCLGFALTAGAVVTSLGPPQSRVTVQVGYDANDSYALHLARRAAWARSLESVRDLIDEADALREQQRQISREVARLYEAEASGRVAGTQNMRDEKELMLTGVRRLRSDLERARAEGEAGTERFHAENLAVIRQSLVDRIEYSRETVPVWDRERALALEESIERDLAELVEQLGGPGR